MNIKAFLLIGLILFSPLLVSAAGLVPCGSAGEAMCTTADFVTMVNGLINFLFSMLGIIAVIALVITGFRMVTSAGNESEWGKAKQMFTNIIIGVVIILTAWLIIDTILTALTGGGLDEWSGGLGDTEVSGELGNYPVDEINNGPTTWHFDGTTTGDFHSYEECMSYHDRVVSSGGSIGPCYQTE